MEVDEGKKEEFVAVIDDLYYSDGDGEYDNDDNLP